MRRSGLAHDDGTSRAGGEAGTRVTSTHATSQTTVKKGSGVNKNKPFWPVALLSLMLGICSVIPYNLLIASDPGSPVFISFVLHLVVVVRNLPRARTLLLERRLPSWYHAGFAVLGYLFSALKSDAFERLPAALCMLLGNTQMLVGVLIQFTCFGTRFSLSQLAGCSAVTFGVCWAGIASRNQAAASDASLSQSQLHNVFLGTSEMLGAQAALTFLNILVKKAFATHGEAVEEQIFVQHLFALPLFLFGPQWDKRIRPRAIHWFSEGDYWRTLLLFVNVFATFGDRGASVQMTGRAPSLLIGHLVQTLKKFLNLFITMLLSVPPWPGAGFWAGSLVLVAGSLYFLVVTDAVRDLSNPSLDQVNDRKLQ